MTLAPLLCSLMWVYCALSLRQTLIPAFIPRAAVSTTRLFYAAGAVDHPFVASYKGKDILILGDGDFSYSAALQVLTGGDSRIIASTRASQEELLRAFPTAEQNTRKLRDTGVAVEYNVDAAALPSSFDGSFDTVIFNFPHIDGKQNIKYNRELLLGFLGSSKRALREGGEIQVALTSSQSGLSAGNMTQWDSSWKLAQQAAEAGLFIAEDRSFPLELFAPLGYFPSGRRGIDKSFGAANSRLFSLRACGSTPSSAQARAVAAPVFVHEVHLLMNRSEPDTSALELRVRQTLREVCREHCSGAELGQSCLLVDTYHCPRTHNTSYVFQIAYASLDGSLSFSREAADCLKKRVEQALPAALCLEPRAEKHRGRISAAYPFYLWAALNEEAVEGGTKRLSTNPGWGAA